MVIRSDQTADYSATQVIAEYLKSEKFDGIKDKGAFGDGYNIALFDFNAVEMTHCSLFRAKKYHTYLKKSKMLIIQHPWESTLMILR